MTRSSFLWQFLFEAKALSINIKVRLLTHTDSNKIEVTGCQLALFNQVHIVNRKMSQTAQF